MAVQLELLRRQMVSDLQREASKRRGASGNRSDD